MRKLFYLCALSLTLLAITINFGSPSVNAEQYICMAEEAAGFKYDKKAEKWQSTRYETDSKFLIVESKNPAWKFEVRDFDMPPNLYYLTCKDGFDDFSTLRCQNNNHILLFVKETGRYVEANLFGYIWAKSKKDEAMSGLPMMKIGKCSPF